LRFGTTGLTTAKTRGVRHACIIRASTRRPHGQPAFFPGCKGPDRVKCLGYGPHPAHGSHPTPMKMLLIACQVVAAAATVPGQIDRACFHGYLQDFCQSLALQQGLVRFVELDPALPRNLVIGPYVAQDQPLVPKTEAPIRDLRSPRGWHVVVSALLIHRKEVINPRLRVRCFDPQGRLRATHDVLSRLDRAEIGSLFGRHDEIFALTSEEEHSYNDQTEIWFLPERGIPRLLLSIPGAFENFTSGAGGRVPGLTIARETYDGIHAETKGTVHEFYAWDRERKVLTLQKQ